jgi:phage-related baseplate assembly protein
MPKNDDSGRDYVVKYRPFKPADPSNVSAYAPDGEAYECTREQAMARFEALVAAGQLGAPMFGIVPFHVRIEDLRLPSPKGREPVRNVVLSRYVPDDENAGPWADERAAA